VSVVKGENGKVISREKEEKSPGGGGIWLVGWFVGEGVEAVRLETDSSTAELVGCVLHERSLDGLLALRCCCQSP